jgi:hypothetical protein
MNDGDFVNVLSCYYVYRVEGKLERYAAMKAMKEPYALPLKKD